MIAIGGIGNPEEQYDETRHNIGFMVLDRLANNLGLKWENKSSLKAHTAKGSGYILFKPITYVNLSGEAVVAIKNFYKFDQKNLWIVHDDADLPLGKINIKFAGSSAGHNGIKSITELLGANYWRIRLGIGKNEDFNLSDHVLSKFTPTEKEDVQDVIDQVVDLLVQSLKDHQLQNQTINVTTKNN